MVSIIITFIIGLVICYLAYMDYLNTCKHKDNVIEKVPVAKGAKNTAIIYVLQCAKCGRIDKKKIQD